MLTDCRVCGAEMCVEEEPSEVIARCNECGARFSIDADADGDGEGGYRDQSVPGPALPLVTRCSGDGLYRLEGPGGAWATVKVSREGRYRLWRARFVQGTRGHRMTLAAAWPGVFSPLAGTEHGRYSHDLLPAGRQLFREADQAAEEVGP